MAVQTLIYGQPEVRYEGCVLDTYERNGYHDSDWYAVCWDEEKQKLVEVEYDTTRAGGGGWARIDATEEVLRKVYRLHKEEARYRFDHFTNPKWAKEYDKGDEVVVIKGRKVKPGTVGTVFWKGFRYNYYARREEERVGIEVDGERQFLPADYVENRAWESRLLKGKARKRKIRDYAVNSMPVHYRQLFA